ncbi:MAG: HPP family protein [Candidatus Marinimicrobia bacterium]|nr:HPP family protein [Candidatus Neomarinimicrobiota bacterium]|tara:strand:- start:418 stop:888 length:471 start_codon:yes stop_codon:yes gene_type:complete
MNIDPKVPSYWKDYILQSSYAAITVFFITLVLSKNPVIIASIGATAFIIFAMPNNIAAEPKRIIGGHFLGFFIGSCFAIFPFIDILFFKAVWYALSIGITILFMVILDFEHPPAAGTALGMTLVGYSSSAAMAIFVSVVLLAFIGYIIKPFLKDLV